LTVCSCGVGVPPLLLKLTVYVGSSSFLQDVKAAAKTRTAAKMYEKYLFILFDFKKLMI